MTTLSRISFKEFKCHQRFFVSLKRRNVLVGPNNSGKSSVVDALKILHGALRYARTRRPSVIQDHEGEFATGYDIPEGSIPVRLENIIYEYGDESAEIEYSFSNGRSLKIQLHPEKRTKLCVDDGANMRTRADFLRAFPVQLVIVPTLGPFEPEEDPLSPEYVRQHEAGRLARRHFRNIWLLKEQDELDEFKHLVTDTWPGIEIERPECSQWPDRRVTMFFREDRRTREVNWSGIGLQIWFQILTHFLRGDSKAVFIIDEPDIYLHPDLQKKLLRMIERRFAQYIIATHSVEIVNESQNEDILIIDKNAKSAQRVTDEVGFQSALTYIGSFENVELIRLSRAKRIIFVEGGDRRILRIFAKHLKFERLSIDDDTLFLPLGGFSFWHRVENTSWTFTEIIGEKVGIFAIFDRDYRCNEEVADFEARMSEKSIRCFVLNRKEIENYFLCSNAIHAALVDVLRRSHSEASLPTLEEIEAALEEATDRFKSVVFSQRQTERRRYLRKARNDKRADATIDQETFEDTEAQWSTLDGRLRLIPGKECLASLNTTFISQFSKSVTPNAIAKHLRVSALDPEFAFLLKSLDEFVGER